MTVRLDGPERFRTARASWGTGEWTKCANGKLSSEWQCRILCAPGTLSLEWCSCFSLHAIKKFVIAKVDPSNSLKGNSFVLFK